MLEYYHRAGSRLDEHGARFSCDGVLLVSREQRRQQQVLSRQPPDIRRLGGWREHLSKAEREACEDIAGPLLAEFATDSV